jgi:hypothetical protein
MGDSDAPVVFTLTNTGVGFSGEPGMHPDDATGFLQGDVFRLSVSIDGAGWSARLRNALAAMDASESVPVTVHVSAEPGAADTATLTLTATSESDPSVTARAIVPLTR